MTRSSAHGIREVIVFHSAAAELAKHEAALPSPLIANPQRELYRQFGIERRRGRKTQHQGRCAQTGQAHWRSHVCRTR